MFVKEMVYIPYIQEQSMVWTTEKITMKTRHLFERNKLVNILMVTL